MQLSFIIPLFNTQAYITKCISSLYEQSLDEKEFEIIVVNDGSTDQSAALIEQHFGHRPNLHLFTQANQGESVARNLGLEKASGDYILFVDADDFLFPNTLSPLLKKANDLQLDMLRFEFAYVDTSDSYTCDALLIKERSLCAEHILKGTQLYARAFYGTLNCWTILYSRQFLKQEGLQFHPQIQSGEDAEFVFRTLLHAQRTMYLPEIVYAYRKTVFSTLPNPKEKDIWDTITRISLLTPYSHNFQYSREFRAMCQRDISIFLFVLFNVLNDLHASKSFRKKAYKQLREVQIKPISLLMATQKRQLLFIYGLFGPKVAHCITKIYSQRKKF